MVEMDTVKSGEDGCRTRYGYVGFGNVLDNIGTTDALAVPIICSAVFKLEFHVLDALVHDAATC